MSIVVIVLFSLALVSLGASFVVEQVVRRRRRREDQAVSPVFEGKPSLIGYKRAFLTPGDLPFEGVTRLHRYGFASEAADKKNGFHAYYVLDEALAHPQEGSVYLEVLAHGNVKHHVKGWIASNQVVLQVMVGDCTDCSGAQASRWVHRRTKGEHAYRFLCLTCADDYTNALSLLELESHLATRCGPGERAPIVGTLRGSELGAGFVPTPDPR